MTKENKVRAPRGILLALLFLANPNIHLIDIFPDFIGYIIIVRALSYASERAPYFAEAVADFKKLAILSFLKIPALVVQTFIRQGNVGDNDVVALFCFTFAAVEIIFVISAIKNLFNAFYYLGQRSENTAILTCKPEGLRTFCFVFAIFKCVAYSLPELFLLTKGVFSGNAQTVFNVARLYPYTIVIFVPAVLTLGIIHAVRFNRYVKTVSADGAFVYALDSLIGEDGREALRVKEWVASVKAALSLFAVASVFALEVRFDNFGGINLFPRFILGAILMLAVYRISEKAKMKFYTLIAPAIYTAVALLHSISEAVFLENFSFDALATSTYAKTRYLLTVILGAAELLAFIATLVFIAALLLKFTRLHTGIDSASDRCSRLDEEQRRKMKRKICIWAVIGSLGGVSRLLNMVFKFYSAVTSVTVGRLDEILSTDSAFPVDPLFPTTSLVTESAVPWFGTLVFIVGLIFIAYSFYLFTLIKDEVELKYQ